MINTDSAGRLCEEGKSLEDDQFKVIRSTIVIDTDLTGKTLKTGQNMQVKGLILNV